MIIVGLTTIPERLEKGIIKKCIKSMLKQTIQADYIGKTVDTLIMERVQVDWKEIDGIDQVVLYTKEVNE